MKSNRIFGGVLLATLSVGAVLALPLSSHAAPRAGAAFQDDSSTVASAVTQKLDKKQFRDVKVTVDNGIATLTGTVDLAVYKSDAAKRAQKVKGVTAVRDQIQVGGPVVPDGQLTQKLLE